MNTIDYIFLGVIAFFILIGMFKGFLGLLLGGFATFLISLAGAVILGMFLGGVLYGSGIASSLQTLLVGKFDALNPIFTQIITSGEGGALLMNGVPLVEAIQAAQLPGFLQGLFEGIMKMLMGAGLVVENSTLTQCLAPAVTRLIVQVATGFVAFFVMLIFLAIIRNLFSKVLDNKMLRYVDRVVGVLVMAVLGCGLGIAFGYVCNLANISSINATIDQSVLLGGLMKLLPIA